MTKIKRIILVNLKSYRSPTLVEQWLDDFISHLTNTPDGIEIAIAVPDLALERIAAKINRAAGISLAAQAVSSFPQGSYTGSTPAAWLRGLVRYCLAGHRERRTYFHETVQDVARQVHEALEEEITPIVCVEGEHFLPQLAAFSQEEREQIYWAFTPRIETALILPKDLDIIKDVIAKISRQSGMRPVLYGSGVTAENCKTLWALPEVHGLMMTEASRDARAFAGLIQRLG
ncbi:MAG: triosephosphate isomerase [Desulfobulbaceae bacterium]|nr:triosephosphate isomerase [Desulfobulbaceae bacterium]